MIPYLRSMLLTAAALTLTVAVAWPNAQATAGAPAPAARTATAAPDPYFHAAVQSRGRALTSATLDAQYTRGAHLFRTRTGLDAGLPIHADQLAAGVRLPHTLAPEQALAQVERVAAARRLPPAQVAALVTSHTEYGPLGLGAPVVNIPLLNLALDALESQR